MSQNVFEQATREKLRFKLPNGNVGVEDLWDVDLETLDEMYMKNNKSLEERKGTGKSLLKSSRPTKADKLLKLKTDIIEHVVSVRQAEIEKAQKQAEIKAKRQKLLDLIDKKKEEELGEKSVEELTAELETLEA